jgi:hypothetical protein
MTQPDVLVPDNNNPLDWNRYSYVRYNPLKYADPTGQECIDVGDDTFCTDDADSYEELGTFDDPQTTNEPTVAEEILEDFDGECKYNCANYVSTVLKAYWLLLSYENGNSWFPGCEVANWVNSAYLFNWLTKKLGFVAIPLPNNANQNIHLPEGTPVFYNDGSYDDGLALNFDSDFRFNHVAVVVDQERDLEGHLVPVVVDEDNTYVDGRHLYNFTSKPQIIWAVLIGVYPRPGPTLPPIY